MSSDIAVDAFRVPPNFYRKCNAIVRLWCSSDIAHAPFEDEWPYLLLSTDSADTTHRKDADWCRCPLSSNLMCCDARCPLLAPVHERIQVFTAGMYRTVQSYALRLHAFLTALCWEILHHTCNLFLDTWVPSAPYRYFLHYAPSRYPFLSLTSVLAFSRPETALLP